MPLLPTILLPTILLPTSLLPTILLSTLLLVLSICVDTLLRSSRWRSRCLVIAICCLHVIAICCLLVIAICCLQRIEDLSKAEYEIKRVPRP